MFGMTPVPLDAVTIGCTTLTLFGIYAMFVSSKPVTVGGVLMILLLSASTTQALMGFLRMPSPDINIPPPKQEDVVDMVRSVFSAFSSRGT
jgi:hypothetical protein